jgi:hypothetical protein
LKEVLGGTNLDNIEYLSLGQILDSAYQSRALNLHTECICGSNFLRGSILRRGRSYVNKILEAAEELSYGPLLAVLDSVSFGIFEVFDDAWLLHFLCRQGYGLI